MIEDLDHPARAARLPSQRLIDQPGDFVAVERLAVEERLRDRIEAGAVATERLAGAAFLLPEDALDLFVDHARGLVGVITGVHEVLAEEDRALRSPRHWADAL